MSSRRANRTPHTATDQAPGGFIPTSGLLSPPPSSIASSATGSTLPTPRHHSLPAGSQKEAAFINYVEKGIQDVGRKFALRDAGAGVDGDGPQQQRDGEGHAGGVARGYASFREAARDLERLVDVVWVSGTLSLQIPHLLSLALLVVTYITAFPPSPRSLFRLLDKLDTAFASLILGQDVQTGEALPSLQGGGRRSKVSGTEKVRIKSLIERTRVTVVEVMSGSAEFEDEDDEVGDERNGDGQLQGEESEGGDEGMMDLDEEAGEMDWEMEVARVYARTLNELGDELVGPTIGIQ